VIEITRIRGLTFPRFAGPFGGEGGIRTPVTLASKAVFKTAAFDHSATSPGAWAAKVAPGPTAAIFARMTATVEFLGTGTSSGVPLVGCDCAVCTSADPKDQRLRSSVLVRTQGRTLLIDAGPDLRQQLLRSRTTAVDAVLITHEHMDHVAGIDELRALNFKLGRAIDIHASPTTNQAIRRMFHYAFAEQRYPGTPELTLHDIRPGAAQVAGVDLDVVEVLHHHMPVLGFRIGGFAYLTDVKRIPPEAMERLRGTHTLVISALRRTEHIAHLNLDQALAVVRELAPAQAYFTHISHLLGTHAEVSAELPPHVALAYDGLRIELP
jgi:phosphoribosyl 1,2-cyclic phosphate phosphodiesterase